MKNWFSIFFRSFSFCAVLLLLIFSFQNCSRVAFKNSESSKVSDSGVPYGGLLKTEFDRFIPDFTCLDSSLVAKSAPVGVLAFSPSGAVNLTENKSLRCGTNNLSLDPQVIDHSIFQTDVIGYLEGIFEGQTQTPESIPANLVEVWCRDRKDDQGIETITHYDHVTHLAVNRTYYTSQSQKKLIPDFSVARSVTATTVEIKNLDQDDFELIVHRDQPAAELGLFKGYLKTSLNGQKIERVTSCRLGGSVDPQVWPNKQIVDFNVRDWILSPDQNFFSYVTDKGKSIYTSAINGKNQKLVATSLYDTLQFNFTPDSQSLVFVSDQTRVAAYSLVVVQRDGSHQSVLETIDETLRSVTGDFKFSKDGATLFYRGGNLASDTMNNWQPLAKWLRAVPVTGGAPKILNPDFRDSLVGVSNFEVGFDKVVFLCCDEGTMTLRPGGQPDLYSVNTDGSDLRKITPPGINGDSRSPFYTGQGLTLDPSGRFVLIGPFAVALDGSSTVQFPLGLSSSLISPSGRYSLLRPTFQSTDSPELVSLKDGVQFPLPALKFRTSSDPSTAIWSYDQSLHSTFFTTDSTALIGRKILSTGLLQAVSIATATGQSTDICPDVTSPVMEIKELGAGQYLLLTLDSKKEILDVYQANTLNCQKLNSVVITDRSINDISSMQLSPDRQKILVQVAATTLNLSSQYASLTIMSNQLYYVPLNGKPALQITTPVYNTATISDAHFLSDSATVIFVGNQLRPTEKGVFQWSASKP